MDKATMYAALQKAFDYVGPEPSYPSQQIQGLTGPYVIDIFQRLTQTSGAKRLVKYYIKDLNLSTEEVIFDGWDPFAHVTAAQTFTEKAKAYTKTLLDRGTYEYITLEDVDEEAQKAFAWAYTINSQGNIVEKAIIISIDANGSLTHKEANVI